MVSHLWARHRRRVCCHAARRGRSPRPRSSPRAAAHPAPAPAPAAHEASVSGAFGVLRLYGTGHGGPLECRGAPHLLKVIGPRPGGCHGRASPECLEGFGHGPRKPSHVASPPTAGRSGLELARGFKGFRVLRHGPRRPSQVTRSSPPTAGRSGPALATAFKGFRARTGTALPSGAFTRHRGLGFG